MDSRRRFAGWWAVTHMPPTTMREMCYKADALVGVTPASRPNYPALAGYSPPVFPTCQGTSSGRHADSDAAHQRRAAGKDYVRRAGQSAVTSHVSRSI